MRRIVLTLLALFIAAMVIPQAGAQTLNTVRVMHVSPDAPNVDVYIDGSKVLGDVPYFAVSAPLSVPDGTYQVAVTVAGESIDNAVLSGELSVEGGVAVTLAALNTVDNIEAALYTDNTEPVPAGKTRVRIIHASPDAPAVDVKLAGTNTAVASGASFRDAVYVEVDAGTYQFDITPAGASDVVFTTPELRFEPGWVYTLVATGEIDKGGFWVQAVVDQVAE